MEGIAFAYHQKRQAKYIKEHGKMSIPERYSKIYIKEVADIITISVFPKPQCSIVWAF